MRSNRDANFKSSRVSLKFGNTGKKESLKLFLTEYRRVVSEFVNELWGRRDIPGLLPSAITSKSRTWLSARMVQCAGKQASGIVRGVVRKQSKRLFMINILKSEGKFKKARKLQKIYDEAVISKPDIKNVEAQLDSRFVVVDWDNPTSFDGWITISSIGNKMKIVLPIKRSAHFNRIIAKGQMRPGVRLSDRSASFCFEMPEAPKAEGEAVLGVDIGMIDVLTCSDGQSIGKDCHGHSYQSICQKLARKKKGSQGFKQAARHRTNFIHWAVNSLNLQGVSVLQRENIRHLRKFKKNNRTMQAWSYRELFVVLEGVASESGVLTRRLNPSYTSQRCSTCGWTWKGNRKGKQFRCSKCDHSQDADLNAALNLSFNLVVLDDKIHQKHPSRQGFYWACQGREPIVPVV